MLATFLQNKYQDLSIVPTPIGTGAWSQAYVYEVQNEQFVIRLSNTRENFDADALAHRLAHKYLPVPEILEIGKLDTQFYAISKLVQGEYLESLSAVALEETLPSLLAVCTGLVHADVPQSTGFGWLSTSSKKTYNSWPEFLLSVSDPETTPILSGWREYLETTPFDWKLYDGVYSALETALQKSTAARRLIHSDLLNFNVLVSENKIAAVVDWGSAKVGDPLYDLAWFEFYEPWYPEFTKISLCKRLREHYLNILADTQNFAERVLACKLHIALDSVVQCTYQKVARSRKSFVIRQDQITIRVE